MKRNIFIIGLIVLVAIIGFLVYQKTRPLGLSEGPNDAVRVDIQKPLVTLRIDDSQKISTYSGINAGTAFEALKSVVDKESIPLVTKQYDFGIFIQKIGEKESGSVMSWIYFINGKSGEVAGDKATLKSGDIVEWNYTKAMY